MREGGIFQCFDQFLYVCLLSRGATRTMTVQLRLGVRQRMHDDHGNYTYHHDLIDSTIRGKVLVHPDIFPVMIWRQSSEPLPDFPVQRIVQSRRVKELGVQR